MKISQNFHENFTKISFENSLVPDEMYAFPYPDPTVRHIPTDNNPADLFTKVLSRAVFEKHRAFVMNSAAEQSRKAENPKSEGSGNADRSKSCGASLVRERAGKP